MSTPATEVGMGAILAPDGVSFRVWAPHAQSVAVVGSFNNWKAKKADQLATENNGYWSGSLKDVRVGDEYRYEIHNRSRFTRIDPYSQAVTSSNGNSVVYDPASYRWKNDFSPAPWNEAVIYELHIGSFYHTGQGEKKHSGTFKDALRKLDYLSDLGVNVVEVLPIHEFPGDLSWGYNPAHLFAVESGYGGPDSFKAFVDAAHERKIAVVLDVVYNHVGPDDCGIWRFDGWSEGEGGGIYFYQDIRSETPWTKSGRPDFGRSEVRQYLRDNAMMWLTDYRVDGLRIDSVSHIRNIHGNNESPEDDIPEGWTFLQWLVDEKNRLPSSKFFIAEDLCCNEAITNPTPDGGLGADSQWDKSFCDIVRNALLAVEDSDRNVEQLKNVIEMCYSGRSTARVIYTESHDEAKEGLGRISKDVDPKHPSGYFAAKRSLLGAVLTFTSPGIPMILQGQEFLEGKYFDADQMVNWSLLKKNKGIFNCFADLIRLRKNVDGVTKGLTGEQAHVYHVDNDAKTLAFLRADRGGRGDDVIIVVNLRNEPAEKYRIGLPSSGKWKIRLNTDDSKYSPEFTELENGDIAAEKKAQDGFDYSGKVTLGPYSALILSQEPK